MVNEMLTFKDSWENYAVAVIFLYISKNMNVNEYIEHSIKLRAYVEYLKYIIICMPDKRPNLQNAKDHILNIFKKADRKEEKLVQQKLENKMEDMKVVIKKNVTKTQSKHLNQELRIYHSLS